ncbi:MAG TPA: LuxR C-terminal-related transcriptional regulator, partial [Anaerolineales bacterium]|nr:LuxR C-terminal-related transcriptional regulator [Anaerolineales bacterium]
FLDGRAYTEPLPPAEQEQFTRLLNFARALQAENPAYELLYHQLLHLFVLNGSRLDLLKAVGRRLRGVGDGQGALLLIGGVSGIGKTSLVMAFQERIRQFGAELLIARCAEEDRASYGVWQGVARAASLAGFSLAALPAPLGQGDEVQSSQHLKQAVADWLKGIATSQPLVILLDDLHWADVDSLEMLNALTQPTPGPILFIATYRSEETHLKHALYDYLPKLQRNRTIDLLHLDRLTRSDIERLLLVVHGARTPELVAYLHERAEGHPLFTVGLLDDLIGQDLLVQDAEGRWLPPAHSVAVPGVFMQLITQRVSRLGEGAERLLSVGAVVGEAWPLKIVEPLVEMSEDELLDVVERALRAGIILIEDEQTEIYRFSHGLIRQVLYTNQLVRRRRRLHEQVAIQIERQLPSNVFALAHHYSKAEQWEKAVESCLRAGEQTIQRFAFYSGLEWFQQALTHAEHAGGVLAPTTYLYIYNRLGRTYQALERRDEAELSYSRMRDIAQSSGDLRAEGQALVNLANLRTAQYQFDLAEKTAYEALKIAEQINEDRLLAQIHGVLGGIYIYRGQLKPAIAHLQEAQMRAETLGDTGLQGELLKFGGYITIWMGQYREAQTYSQTLIQQASKSVDPFMKLSGYQNLGWSQLETGQYQEAYLTFLSVIEMEELAKGHFHNLPRLLNLMGYLHLELGGGQEALAWDQKALLTSWLNQSQGNYEMRRYSLLNIATDYLYLEQWEAVRETLAQFEAITEASESARFRYFNRYQLLMSELYLKQGSDEYAIEWAQDARSLAEANGILKNIAKAHWLEGKALAGLKRYDEAISHLEKGVSIADNLQHGSLPWKIRLSLADVLQKAGKSSDAVLRRARELIEQVTHSLTGSPLQAIFLASPWLRQLEALEHPSAPPKTAYPAGLTQREVEILQLVAKGATNQQIADVLHISVRTVNTHITNILNKTGLGNRTAASAFAVQNKLV